MENTPVVRTTEADAAIPEFLDATKRAEAPVAVEGSEVAVQLDADVEGTPTEV